MLPVCSQTCFQVRPQRLSASQFVRAFIPRNHCCCPATRHTDAASQTRKIAEDACHNWPLKSAAVVSAAVYAAVVGVPPSHAAGAISNAAAAAAASTEAAAIVPVDPSKFVPGPVEVGWQIWFAAIISTIPFVIGAYEFGKRILIQRRCEVCGGSGLVQMGKYPKKCPQCGGFFPWISWKMFLSANARPGNGGPLLQPRGQTSVFYSVPPSNDGTVENAQSNSPDSISSGGLDSSAVQPEQGQRQGHKTGQSNSSGGSGNS